MATQVEAQITGNVWKIEKAVGDSVAEGESMGGNAGLVAPSRRMVVSSARCWAAGEAGIVSEVLGGAARGDDAGGIVCVAWSLCTERS